MVLIYGSVHLWKLYICTSGFTEQKQAMNGTDLTPDILNQWRINVFTRGVRGDAYIQDTQFHGVNGADQHWIMGNLWL